MLHPSKKYDSGNILKVQFVLGFLFVFVSMWVPNVHWDASGVQITGTLDPVVRLTVKWCYSKWRTDKEILSLCLVLRCRLLGSGVLLLGVNRGLGLRPFQKSKQRSFFFSGGFCQSFSRLSLFRFSYLFWIMSCSRCWQEFIYIIFSQKWWKWQKRRYRSLYLYIFCFLSHLLHFLLWNHWSPLNLTLSFTVVEAQGRWDRENPLVVECWNLEEKRKTK